MRYVLQAISTPIAVPLSPAAAVWIIVIPARRTQTALFARPDILTMSVNAMPVTLDSTKPAQALRSYALPASPTVIPAPTPQPAQHVLLDIQDLQHVLLVLLVHIIQAELAHALSAQT